jgi:hypothetical protein
VRVSLPTFGFRAIRCHNCQLTGEPTRSVSSAPEGVMNDPRLAGSSSRC